ncbi:response regulator [Anaerosacchariphilus polymeriproducens]|uniref:Stage 0 sporulation protein A homolog n=1 Tax=Anaerosacchariphilus polymeriproducens TaxID=1812858 RepID=A0A371AXB3_9FIRM|nr:response regulator [Anaerosacchariphilus polymeriproducens]RDU24216.1 response regulator [Anaerosacchariphilus polymeriproducens]
MLGVLIVDDEEKVCTLIQYLVDWEKMGLQVIGVANDGITAMGIIEEKHPDIVITDIQMPGYNGLEVIQQVRERYPEIYFIIISGYRQFDYAHQAIKFGVEDYLLKPIKQDELNSILDKIIKLKKSEEEIKTEQELLKQKLNVHSKKIKQNLLWDILNINEEFLDYTIEQLNNKYDCNFQSGIFQVLIFKADFSIELEQEKVHQMLDNKMIEMIEKEFQKDTIEQVTYLGEEGVYLLYNAAQEDKDLRWKLKHIRNKLNTLRDVFPGMFVTVGIGNYVKNVSELPKTVYDARNAILNRLFKGVGKNIVVTPSQQPGLEAADIINSEFQVKFLDYMDVYHLDGILQLLKKIERTLREEPNSDGILLLRLINDILDIYFLSLKKMQLEVDISQSKIEFMKIFYSCLNIEDVFEKLFHFIKENLETIMAERKNVEAEPIIEAKKYIIENYNNNLKFEELAEKLGFNYAYFSTLFKKETGQTLTEYVLSIRIQKAKNLLLDPEVSIMEVAESVGYSDLKYFGKQFKKVTNLSPKEYKKLFMQK